MTASPEPAAIVVIATGPGPNGCQRDGFCIATGPHDPAEGHVDATGHTWDDPDHPRDDTAADDDADAVWECHQDEGTWPAGYGPRE